MHVKYLDLQSGQIAGESGISDYALTEGNYSCDCNRWQPFGHESVDACQTKRYIVIDVYGERGEGPIDVADVIKRANADYFNILKARYE